MKKENELHQLIEKKVFIKNKDQQIDFSDNPNTWIFDFRQLLMNGRAADLISELFYERFSKEYPFQICALEIAGVPLATSLMTKFYAKGHQDINAFFIRKSRKKTGLFRMIEGEVQDEKKIILVDDVMNSGGSLWRQIEALEALDYTIDTVWVVLRYRDESYYKRFHKRGIKVKSLFTLDDFTNSLGDDVKNLVDPKKLPPKMFFTPQWVFRSKNPSLGWVVNKSQPLIDDERIYYGSDDKHFWAINQNDGSVAWKYSVGYISKRKTIFSNPAIYKDTVIFGAYDGNVYCLNKKNGDVQWISFEADFIGSSPSIAHDLGIVFIGLEYGLIGKRGGIIALNATTGKPIWIDRTHKALTHCSPLYIEEHQQVAMGSNDGLARLYDAHTGEILWTFLTFGGANTNPSKMKSGFSDGDIKESFVYSETYDYVIFGSIDGFLYILDRKTGHLVHYFKCEGGIFSTPCLYKDKVYFVSTDRHLRCLDLKTLQIVFAKNIDNTRIFSTPVIINDRLYVGTNAGRLHELDPTTGEPLCYFQAVERITNSIVYNKTTDTYFLPTFANEIIALRRDATLI